MKELNIGSIVNVRNNSTDVWEKRKLLAILPEQQAHRYICEANVDADAHVAWKYCEPIVETEERWIMLKDFDNYTSKSGSYVNQSQIDTHYKEYGWYKGESIMVTL